jgi:D-glycero-D-manno-heptose 1,7-bisphosphate phosphatase
MLQAIFLDRDGVINRERADYVKSWDEFQLLPNVLDALQKLATLHIPICVITNQSAVARGHLSPAALAEIHQRLSRLVTAQGGQIDAFFVCPHHPDDACACRKPKPGLLHQAAHQFDLDLRHCLFIGDAYTDYLAATAAHCHSMLVKSGRQGAELPALLHDTDVPIYPSLVEAVDEIFRRCAKHS